MRSSSGRFGMSPKQKFKEQQSVPKLLGRREIELPSAGTKTNELIATHTCIREGLFLFTHVLRNISYGQSVKTRAVAGRPSVRVLY